MDAICLLVAGVVRATVPTTELTLVWEHSVEKTRWQERYRVVGGRLKLTEARVQGFGAGMEPPAGAVLEKGAWRWTPELEPLPELRLTFSEYAPDYRLCWSRRCKKLASLIRQRLTDGDVVAVRACAVDARRQ